MVTLVLFGKIHRLPKALTTKRQLTQQKKLTLSEMLTWGEMHLATYPMEALPMCGTTTMTQALRAP
jgi:hypothetical protein